MGKTYFVRKRVIRSSSNKNIFLFILFISSLFSGCLNESNTSSISNSSSISVESEVVWIRAEGDILATIDMDATLTVRDIFNGNIIASQRLNGTLIDSGVNHCDLVASHPSNTDIFPNQSCLMVNGDFSRDEGLRRLHLNICLVGHRDEETWEDYLPTYSDQILTFGYGYSASQYDAMEIQVCEFLDFTAAEENLVVGEFDDFDLLSLIGRNVSGNTYAITYPTESGTIRVYSNNSMVNLDTGEEYLIPIPVSCDDIWAYNCSNWPSTQEEIQKDPDIWYWYSPMIPPYPAENGTRWYVTHCSNRPHDTWYTTIVVYDLKEGADGTDYWFEDDTYSAGGGFSRCEVSPIVVNELRHSRIANINPNNPPISPTFRPELGGTAICWSSNHLGSWVDMGCPFVTVTSCLGAECPWFSDMEPQEHHFRASWFWSRLWFSCLTDQQHMEWNSTAYDKPVGCISFQNFDGVSADIGVMPDTEFLGPFDFERFVVWDEQKGDWGNEEFLQVLYADGANIRVAPDNIGLFDGWDQSSRMGNLSPIVYLIVLLAVSTVFSRNVNSSMANITDKYSKKKDIGDKIRSLHYSQWESRDGPSVDMADGLVSVVSGLILLSIYSLYLVLVAAVYLAIASLVVMGIVLVLGGYLVGGVCFFIGIVLLGPLLG